MRKTEKEEEEEENIRQGAAGFLQAGTEFPGGKSIDREFPLENILLENPAEKSCREMLQGNPTGRFCRIIGGRRNPT